jgi:signal transduction histidine kinase
MREAICLRGRGLTQALEEYLAGWSRRTGVAARIWAMPDDRAAAIGEQVTQNVHATVREALANIERHGYARSVNIAITLNTSGLRLTVSGDGGGRVLAQRGRLLRQPRRRGVRARHVHRWRRPPHLNQVQHRQGSVLKWEYVGGWEPPQ